MWQSQRKQSVSERGEGYRSSGKEDKKGALLVGKKSQPGKSDYSAHPVAWQDST